MRYSKEWYSLLYFIERLITLGEKKIVALQTKSFCSICMYGFCSAQYNKIAGELAFSGDVEECFSWPQKLSWSVRGKHLQNGGSVVSLVFDFSSSLFRAQGLKCPCAQTWFRLGMTMVINRNSRCRRNVCVWTWFRPRTTGLLLPKLCQILCHHRFDTWRPW
jgi:hypothetical protein